MPRRLGHRRKLVCCEEHMMARARRNGQMKNPRFACAVVALLAGFLTPAGAFAQSDSSNQSVQELRKQLDELREQMNKVQARLSEMESTKGTEITTPQTGPS